jgi:hypothetical protein
MATIARVVPLGLILLGVFCVIVAALRPVSRQKGQMRLLASLLGGAAVSVDSVTKIGKENLLWPAIIQLVGGFCLIWLGLRKFKRDPKGKTPAAQML